MFLLVLFFMLTSPSIFCFCFSHWNGSIHSVTQKKNSNRHNKQDKYIMYSISKDWHGEHDFIIYSTYCIVHYCEAEK